MTADATDDRPDPAPAGDDGTSDMGDLFDELEELEGMVASPEAREQVRETMRVAMEAARPASPFGRVIRGYDRGDLAEAFLGSILFGIPMAVEGGTQEVGAFLVDRPLYFVGTALFAVGLTIGILYVADIQHVRVHKPILGLVPRRLVGVLGVSFLTAVVLLTAWGRIDWGEPAVALANAVVAFVPMSIGASLGDLLPGT